MGRRPQQRRRLAASTASARADWHLGNTNTGAPGTPSVDYRLDWIFGSQDIDVEDKEDWGQIDGTYFTDGGVMQSLDFGVRWRQARAQPAAGHRAGTRTSRPTTRRSIRPTGRRASRTIRATSATASAATSRATSGSSRRTSSPHFNDLYANRDPVARFYYPGAYGLEETQRGRLRAAELRAVSAGRANIGMRYVRTEEDVAELREATDPTAPGVITTSAFGPYQIVVTKNTYKDWLPSANLKWDMTTTWCCAWPPRRR